jgi:tRNA A-37 threonylcarbamoyl transferase component Bud32
VQLRLDRSGHILYGCEGGFCELQSRDVADWRPGTALNVTRHKAPTRTNYATGLSVVWKDRFGCVWMRGSNDASYQCPGNPYPITLPESVASSGFPLILELDDGAIVIPGHGKLALGRPGKFRVLTALNGYPSAGTVFVTKDGSLWISNANGLFVLPLRLNIEFWSQREGLEGNAWSVLHLGMRVFAIAGDTVCVLDRNRSRWRLLARIGNASHLLAGPHDTLFVGSHTSGVVQMTTAGRIVRRSDPVDIAMLARTPDGQLWASGSGIFRVVANGPRLNLEPVNIPGPPGGGKDMKVDETGSLWACYAGGLIHHDASGWRRTSKEQGLQENECNAFALDPGGDVWYGYNTLPGISLIHNARSGNPVIQHLQGNGEWGILQSHFLNFDRRDWLWRGESDGVFIADPQTAREGQWLRLSHEDGLPAADTNQKAFFEDADGSVWLGADSSIIHILPPGDLIHPNYAPSIFVSAFSADGGPEQLATLTDAIKSGANLVAHVGSLQFDRRSALSLRYRLLPEQPSWTSQHDLDLHLGKLRWGRHTLEVQARLGSGPWSAMVVKSFVVLTPVWLSWPMLLGCALAVSCAVLAGRRWRKKRRERADKTFPELAEWRLAALSPEAKRLEGSVLDQRFEVGRVLARGGFATVAEGVDLCNGRKICAIKIFRPELVDKDWMTRRFQQEVLALEKIQHPNVVRIYGHGTTPAGAPYLVMEFVSGKTLREVLEAGAIPRMQTASYLRQTARALAGIHAHGIFHRDLKPDNLMIRGNPPPGEEIVLIDFSIAIVKDADETLHGLSRAAGTMYYMAPEQAIGYADSSTDIHSLAKILMEMLTGQRLTTLLPDAAMDLSARVRELLHGLPLALSSGAIDCISAALEFDPSRRPHDANAFADAVAEDLETRLEPPGGVDEQAFRGDLSASHVPFPNDAAPGGT